MGDTDADASRLQQARDLQQLTVFTATNDYTPWAVGVRYESVVALPAGAGDRSLYPHCGGYDRTTIAGDGLLTFSGELS